MYPIEKYQFKVYEHTNEDGTKSSIVIALSTYAGKIVKGVAKCMAGDPFDLEKGSRLAAARCDYKVCLKRMKRATKKYNDAEMLLKEAQEHVRQMGNYFADAKAECFEAKLRLDKIESELN